MSQARHSWSETQADEVVALLAQGFSRGAIGNKFGVSRGAVYNRRAKAA
jgi:hypothetical protein